MKSVTILSAMARECRLLQTRSTRSIALLIMLLTLCLTPLEVWGATTITANPTSITFATKSSDDASDASTIDISVSEGYNSYGNYIFATVESDDEDKCEFTINNGCYSYSSGNNTSVDDLSVEYVAIEAGTFTGRIIVEGYNSSYAAVQCTIPLSVTITAACTARTLTFANASISKDYGTAAGKYQDYTLSAGSGTVTWTSDDPTIASVASNGVVTINKSGSTYITASVANDGTYCRVEDLYELTVNAVAPTVTKSGLAVSNITSTSATFTGGQASATGGASITQYGYVFGTSADVDWSSKTNATGWNSTPTLNSEWVSRELPLNILAPNTTYYVRPFAYNGSVRGYGDAVQFTTLQRYAISYNNNGGANSMDGAYKDHGVSFTLPSDAGSMTKSHYHIAGWLLGSASGRHYDLGGSYTDNAAATFYAEWAIDQHTVSFNANGGTGSMDDVEKDYNSTYDLPACTFTPPTGKVFDHWGEGSANGTSRTTGYTHTVTADITYYAVWRTASYDNYRFSCAELELEGEEDALVFVTSSAGKKVRSQEAFHVTGSGLTPGTALTFSFDADDAVNSKFAFKLADGSNPTTDASGAIDEDIYVFYTPAVGDTEDGLDAPSGLTAAMATGEKKRQVTLSTGTTLKGRHLPDNFVIAAKNPSDGKWYALPANMTKSETNPAPVEIVVDNTSTPTMVLTPNVNVFTLYAQGNLPYVKLAMHGKDNAPMAGDDGTKAGIGKSLATVVTNDQGTDYQWQFAQTQPSVSNAEDATYNMTVANGNAKYVRAWWNASGGAKWGLYANGTNELRLIPYIANHLAADVNAWTQQDAEIEANISSIDAEKVVAVLDGTTSGAKALSSTGAANTYIAKFAGEIDFADKSGETLILKWLDEEDALKAATFITMPSIIAAGSSSTWSALATAPTDEDIVVLTSPMTVNAADAQAKAIVIDQSGGNTGKLTVNAGKELVVAERVHKYNGSCFGATAVNDLIIRSTIADGNAALVMGNHDGTNQAYVEFASKSHGAQNSSASVNQFVGTPFSNTNVLYNYYDSWIYGIQYKDGVPGWERINGGDAMSPFAGYALIYNGAAGHIYEMTGKLVATDNRAIDLVYNGATKANNENLLANSWTAPIQITAFETSDFTNTEATIYMFNAGSPDDEKTAGDAAIDATKPAQWITVPINSATWLGIPTLQVIPSMQSFSVFTTGSSPSLTLDYSKLVYAPAAAGTAAIVPNRMRRQATDEAPQVIRLDVSAESGYGDQVVILEREDFTEGFDNGWDGHKLYGEAEAPQLYARSNDGEMAVSCVPEIEGTILGFKAGNQDSNYTITMHYEGDAEALYLIDTHTGTYTRVMTGATYSFTTGDTDPHNRFVLSRRAPTIATGNEVPNDDGRSTKAVKFIENDKLWILRNGVLYDATGRRAAERRGEL